MSSMFLASVVFTVNGARRTIDALVMGADERDAIQSAVNAVRQLFPDAEIIGGMLERMGEEDGPDAREMAAEPRPAGASLH